MRFEAEQFSTKHSGYQSWKWFITEIIPIVRNNIKRHLMWGGAPATGHWGLLTLGARQSGEARNRKSYLLLLQNGMYITPATRTPRHHTTDFKQFPICFDVCHIIFRRIKLEHKNSRSEPVFDYLTHIGVHIATTSVLRPRHLLLETGSSSTYSFAMWHYRLK
jgi:hypothetical protein